jgi:hypothetical protein
VKAIDNTADLQSSLDALVASHSETQTLLFDEIDRAAVLTGIVSQIRAMSEQWVVAGCHTETAKDLVQLILAAIVSQAPETATLLSENEALIGFIPEAYKRALSARITLEEAQDAALRELLNQRIVQPFPGGVN